MLLAVADVDVGEADRDVPVQRRRVDRRLHVVDDVEREAVRVGVGLVDGDRDRRAAVQRDVDRCVAGEATVQRGEVLGRLDLVGAAVVHGVLGGGEADLGDRRVGVARGEVHRRHAGEAGEHDTVSVGGSLDLAPERRSGQRRVDVGDKVRDRRVAERGGLGDRDGLGGAAVDRQVERCVAGELTVDRADVPGAGDNEIGLVLHPAVDVRELLGAVELAGRRRIAQVHPDGEMQRAVRDEAQEAVALELEQRLEVEVELDGQVDSAEGRGQIERERERLLGAVVRQGIADAEDLSEADRHLVDRAEGRPIVGVDELPVVVAERGVVGGVGLVHGDCDR